MAFSLQQLNAHAQFVIDSHYEPFSYEELSRSANRATNEFDNVLDDISDLQDYIANAMGQNISPAMRKTLSKEYDKLQNVAQELFDTGNIRTAKYKYMQIRSDVQAEVARYNSQISSGQYNY